MTPSVAPLGDSAVTVTFGEAIDPSLSRRVWATAERIRAAMLPSVREVVAAYAALAVYYDPLHTDFESLSAQLNELSVADGGTGPALEPREFRIPVRYDGPDLEEVAVSLGLASTEVIERHSAPWYQVYLIGFVPGFAYLGELDPKLVLPRRSEPRARVPAGAVAIGGAQTSIYPLETPGGWHLIGTTDTVLFDAHRSPPALLRLGDRVRFEPILP